MRKKKIIFLTILSVLLITLSITVISLFHNMNNTVTEEDIANDPDIQYHLQYLTLQLAREVDPDYQILTFDGGIAIQETQAFLQDFYNVLYNVKELFDEDENLIYYAKNTLNQKEISHNQKRQNEDYIYFQKFSYNDKGEFNTDIISQTQDMNLNRLLSYELNVENNRVMGYIEGVEYDIPLSAIHFNAPMSLRCIYQIPKALVYSGYVASFVDPWNHYYPFIIVTIGICTFIIGIFMLLYPIEIVEKINPFLTIKTWKAEFLFITLFFIIFLSGLGTIMVGGYTMTGELNKFLLQMNLSQTKTILFILNIMIFILLLLFIAIAWFIIKYIFVYGFTNYLKTHTALGTLIKYLRKKINILASFDLSQAFHKYIFKFVLWNMIIIFCLIVLKPLGYILLFLYSFMLYFYLYKNIIQIKADYTRLLQITQELGQGHFENEIDEDLGIFNSLKKELNQIKEGFEKAVQEETKSQNLKTELISNVSHDLKTPITCIKNYVYLLKNENLEQEKRNEYIDNLESYTNRLTTLIEDLFEVSKVNTGNIQLNQMNLNIIDLLDQTIAESEDLLNSKQLKIIKDYKNRDIILYLDGDKTYRIFENLLSNIGKYALTNSRVYIDVYEQEDKVYIQFKNISEEQMNFSAEEIVERFVRGDKARHETGSGIGLAIAKSFTEVQNGTFDIKIDGDLFKVIICFYENH